MSSPTAVPKVKRAKRTKAAQGAPEAAASAREVWHLVDAENQVLGRLASRLAVILMGKHRPGYERHIRTGDNVVVINAAKIRVTGNKLKDKRYQFFSGYPDGRRDVVLERMLTEQPEYPLMHAVKGMLPKNALGHRTLTRLKVYPGVDHPHAAQKPVALKLE
jgi:large subunit ribosomal protein L13